MMDWLTTLQWGDVRPFYGCPETLDVLYPYILPVGQAGVAGVGFFVAWLFHRAFERYAGMDRRSGPDRRIP